MSEKWFVILLGHGNRPMPMIDDDDFLALFDSETEANTAADANAYARAYGYEVYSLAIGGV